MTSIDGKRHSQTTADTTDRWNNAINAVQSGDETWLHRNRRHFRAFFRQQNLAAGGRLCGEALEAHYRHGLFKLFLGPQYGGLALDLDEGARWIEHASRLEGNWGWLLAIGVGGAYFADYMEPDIAAALYSPPEAVVAGSGQPGGNAVRDDGALRVDGSWDYCSGCHHASFFTAGARVEGRPRAVILPPEQVTIRESWNAIGLRLTSSHTVTANPARISENQLFDLENPPLPAIYPISRYPFMAFAQSCFAPAVSGMAIALMEEAEQLLEHKRAKWSVSDEARPRYIENTIRNFVEQWRIRRARFYTALKESWHSLKAGEPVTEEAVARAALDWTAFSYHGAADLMPCLGMDALARDHPLQQMWQDLQTGYQHMSLHSY